jgi:hypothetical protein
MIRIFSLLMFVFTTHSGFTSPRNWAERLQYTETVDCGSIGQADIFRRARLQLLKTNTTTPLLLQDKETGDLVSRGLISVTLPRSENYSGGSFTLSYVFSVECVNRKYRATISDIMVLQGGNQQNIAWESYTSQPESLKLRTVLDTRFAEQLEILKKQVRDYQSF